jgi:protein involved in polysaccharide export with SLBB domain
MWGRLRAVLRRIVPKAVFLFPAALLTLLLVAPAPSQGQIPELGPEQLQKLRQQFGGQQDQSLQLDNSAGEEPFSQRSVILQPAVPPTPREDIPTSRLEQIMSARAGARLRQFGYDQLGRAASVVVPQAGAIQDSYVLGPGDDIIVSLRGQENSELRATVNRDGQVVLPRLNPIPAMGRTLGDFRRDLDAAVSRAYVATSAFVSIGRVRQISVLVSGEVNNPGLRLVTGLSSVVDALLLSGGVKKSGSLRAIRVQRGNTTRTVDLYSVLTSSGGEAMMRLADGDRILVPSLGRTVAVSGLVRRPGIFELPPGVSSISTTALLNLAGGQEVRGRYRFSVMEILPDGRSRLVPVQGTSAQVKDSETLFVQLGADQTVGQAVLSGGTGLAGNYPVAGNVRLSDLLKAPGALGTTPYTPFGIIVRKDPKTLIRQMIAFTPVAVLNGREDMVLQSDDVVRVLSVNEERLLNYVVRAYLTQLAQDQNQIRNPLQTEPGNNNQLFRQLADQSGQDMELENTSSVPAHIQRKDITALLDTPAPDSDLALERTQREQRLSEMTQSRQMMTQLGDSDRSMLDPSARQNQVNSLPGVNPYLGNGRYPAPTGYYPKTPGYPDSNVRDDDQLRDDAAVPRSGGDRREREPTAAPNFTQQSVPSGGFALNREVQTFGQFSRQLSVDPLVLVNFLIDHRARLDGAVRGPGSYFVGPNATLDDLVQAAGGTLNWADTSSVELISTAVDVETGRAITGRRVLALGKGDLANYLIHPRDQFRLGQVSTDVGVGSVTIQGEVRYPGTFSILRGEHLSDVLVRAGGLTNTAYPYGTVYLRQSAAQAERQAYVRAADEVQDQLMIAMTRVGNGKIDPNTFTAMQSFIAELRNHQALGRVSFVADPKELRANPARDPLLEAGDVIYIPPRPSTVAVLGQVLQPGNFIYRKGATIEDYIKQAGGYSSIADESHTYIVLPNGEARRVSKSWLTFEVTSLPPGSSIVIPRDVTPLDLRQTIIDVSQIFSQFAVSIASIAVLSKQ